MGGEVQEKRTPTTADERRHYQVFGSSRNGTHLWRYLDFEKFVWLLETSSLYHVRLDCLGDPYEGSVTTPYARKRDSGEIYGYTLPEIEPINNVRLTLTSFVTCWHANDAESAAMWRLYAHERRGVAIVSDVRGLEKSVDTSPFAWGILGPVEYFDYDQDDMSDDFGLTGRPGFSKRKAFEYEREVRGLVHVQQFPKNPNDIFTEAHLSYLRQETQRGVAAGVNLPGLIHEIVVAPDCEPWFLDLVRRLATKYALGQRVRPSKLNGVPVY